MVLYYMKMAIIQTPIIKHDKKLRRVGTSYEYILILQQNYNHVLK